MTLETCSLEPFKYQSVSQPDLVAGASSNQINEQELEGYLARLAEAVCNDLTALQDAITAQDERLTAIEARVTALETP